MGEEEEEGGAAAAVSCAAVEIAVNETLTRLFSWKLTECICYSLIHKLNQNCCVFSFCYFLFCFVEIRMTKKQKQKPTVNAF